MIFRLHWVIKKILKENKLGEYIKINKKIKKSSSFFLKEM